jgi:hypothetical protein
LPPQQDQVAIGLTRKNKLSYTPSPESGFLSNDTIDERTHAQRDCVVMSLRGSETTDAIRPRAFRLRATRPELVDRSQGRGAHGREAIS